MLSGLMLHPNVNQISSVGSGQLKDKYLSSADGDKYLSSADIKQWIIADFY